MSDEGQVIRGINWRQTFPFINIFRAFKIAKHLSKLALGLALLISVYVGGRVLDGVWASSGRALPGEISQYSDIQDGKATGTLATWRDDQHKQIDLDYANMLVEFNVLQPQPNEMPDALLLRAQDDSKAKTHLGDLQTAIDKSRDDGITQINNDYNAALKDADDEYNKDTSAPSAAQARDDAKESALRTHDAAIIDAYSKADAAQTRAVASRGDGLFSTFFEYEIRQVYVVVDSVSHNEWLGGDGVIAHIYDFFAIGPVWLIFNHTVFFILFGLWFLLNWAVFGGAICRIAAVEVARDEKISIRQAMNFAVSKVLSFGSAPVIPILVVIVIGLLVSIGSLLSIIPFLGPIIIGAFFFVALIAAFVMAVVLLGAGGGFNLMYPTIAVEGSDSFDAISRSFSYVFNQPWRMLFYTIVALIYGAATYLFVHCFIWMMLVLTHHFIAMGMFSKAANTQDLLSVMWPSPSTAGRLSYVVHYSALSFGQKVGAILIRMWVMLLVSFLGAFAISLYFCANTIIYFLMRNEVDSTEIDDVYLEQFEDDLEIPAAGTPEPTSPVADPTPAVSSNSVPPATDAGPPSA
jgi:hypothetical protein